uniref:Uncharacterized protein n=1 Tax=Ixodes ricinus TaxID=34613 RepID=A0A131XSW2_IXORI
MKGFCSVLLPPFANMSGQIVTKLPVLTPLCYGYIHTATGARLARKKKNLETAECGEWQYVRSITRAVLSTAG